MSKAFDPIGLPHPKIPASAIPPEWPVMVRETSLRTGQAIRGPIDRATIEVKSLTTNRWGALMLPGNGFEFTTPEERDIILAQIQGR